MNERMNIQTVLDSTKRHPAMPGLHIQYPDGWQWIVALLTIVFHCFPVVSTADTTNSTTQESPRQPNIILIVSDDAGYADFGFQGSKVIPTPNLDRLAASGIRFTNAYAGSVCSPSRAALVTGAYQSRIGYEFNIPENDMIIGTSPVIGLKPDQMTMFRAMRDAGYRTSVIGKWHLGLHRDNVQNGKVFRRGNQPCNMGVDEFRGLLGGSRSYWVGSQNGARAIRHQFRDSNGRLVDQSVEDDFNGRYVTDVFGDWSVDFIREHADKPKPFFLYTSFTAPHTPMEAMPADLEFIDSMEKKLRGKRRIYAAMTFAMDRAIGRIMNAVKDPDSDGNQDDSIASNTLIFFVNDNGGDCCDKDPNGCSNYPLKGGKGSSWEGGFRIPMLVAGSGVSDKLSGTQYEQPVHLIDVLPTMLGAAGRKDLGVDAFDGVNLLPYLNQNNPDPPHQYLYLRRGHNQQVSIRKGDWKLYHSRPLGFRLFNLKTNIQESLEKDALADHPELVSELQAALTSFDAQMARPNWKMKNESTVFRFRESLKSESRWSEPSMWIDNQFDTGKTTLTYWDGFADTELVFRPGSRGKYVSINDMTRQSGLPFMVNRIRYQSRDSAVADDSSGIISGNAIAFTESRSNKPAMLQLVSVSPEKHNVIFEIACQIQLLSDFVITGDGRDNYLLSGGIRELKPGINILKKGRSTVTLSGTADLSGTIELMAGKIIVKNLLAVGNSKINVSAGATLQFDCSVPATVAKRFTGDGSIVMLDSK